MLLKTEPNFSEERVSSGACKSGSVVSDTGDAATPPFSMLDIKSTDAASNTPLSAAVGGKD